MPSTTVEILEERWSPTTVHTAFVFRSLPRHRKSGPISIDLPLLNLGWTFALSLTPDKNAAKRRYYGYSRSVDPVTRDWIPATFSFRQHSSAIPWGDTSIHAELSLGEECTPHNSMGSNLTPLGATSVASAQTPSSELPTTVYEPDCPVGQFASHNNTASNLTPLGTMDVVLARASSLELPTKIRRTISSLRPNKVWLTVTISNCPLANGLFQARSGPVNEAEVQAQLVRQSGDRLLSRSLATGKHFDVKFLTFSTSSDTGRPLPTYASLSVLEEHVNLSSSILRKGWANALNCSDDTGAKDIGEILCPEDHEYELDSDFEDEEDEASSPPCERDSDQATLEGQQSECRAGGSSSSLSLSSFVDGGASDQCSVNYQHQEVIKGPKEPSSDSEQTVLVKFAAHRTWQAFSWYCYTGNLEFGKLKSQVEPGVQRLRVTPLEVRPPTCSPKSMYRLADLVGDNDLKAKALAAIKERMTEANVLDETFSVFTSKYPDVREAQLGVLMEHCESPKVKGAFLRAMGKYGSMPHAEPVLSAFYDNLVA